jgi:Histidyl-tRNA synthetase
MAKQVGPARGMRDFLPAEKRRRDDVLDTIQRAYARHGFEPIETPAVEDHDTLHSGLGGDNEKLSFGILRRGLEAADLSSVADPAELADLGLRFDLTVPLARYVANHHHELPDVFRALHVGPVWRADDHRRGDFASLCSAISTLWGESSTLAESDVLLATLVPR